MDWSQLAEGIRPWISTTALVGLFGLVVKLWLDNKKLNLDSEGGIRDHYSREVASLRAQVLAVQQSATLTASAAEERYNQAIQSADVRHATCEAECDRLRERVVAMERKFQQLHQSALRLFEPRSTLSEEIKDHMRSLEQMGMTDEEIVRRQNESGRS